MTNEPQNRSEEWLKAYAQQRRAEAAPHELHPATRRLLQAEAARTHARPVAEVAPAEDIGLFGRWSFNALAIAAVGVVAAVIGVLVSDSQQPKPAKFAGSPKSVSEADTFERLAAPAGKYAETAAATANKLAENLPLPNAAAPAPSSATAPVTRSPQPNSVASAGRAGAEAGAGVSSDLARASAPVKNVLAATPPAEIAPGAPSASAITAAKSRALNMSVVRRAPNEPQLASSDKPAASKEAKEGETKADAFNEAANTLLTAKKVAPSAAISPAAAFSGAGGPTGFAVRGVNEKTNKADGAQGASYLQQNFSQTAAREQQAYRRNLNAPGEPRVLVNFQLEREGDVVRVVDSDGSVYLGNVVVGEAGRKIAPDARREEMKQEPVKRDELLGNRAVQLRQEQSKVSAEAFDFQVIGTNRSLRQRVLFEGNYQMPVMVPESQLKGAAAKDAAGNQRDLGGVKQQQQLAPAPRVQGRAVIGGNRIEVDAVPVPVSK
ncbi:MAG: hypothetical protein EXS29_06225 [Pedosphaera sp.]|nr:hypothetical protein [Pedosphaera sp.]MST00889.1 hypothetical protein [Pedosphaera sp.]